MTEWTSELPVEDGFYWFYSKMGFATPMLKVARVRVFTDGTMYILGGQAIHKKEIPQGLWQRIPDPVLPQESECP